MYNYGLMPMRVIRVSGKPGAEAYQMAPNSEVLLLDETQPVVWLKTTDGAGYPRLTPYDISIHEEEKPIDYKSFDERLKRLEELYESHAVTAFNTEPHADAPAIRGVQTEYAGERPGGHGQRTVAIRQNDTATV